MKLYRIILNVVFGFYLFVSASVLAQSPNAGEAQFLSNTRQLILDGKRSGEGYFSPDGQYMVFQSEREPDNPFFQIYMLSFESGETWLISPGIGKTTCAFIRPGYEEVLFASTHLDPQAKAKQKAEIEMRSSGKQRRYSWDYDEYMDIFVSDFKGNILKRLTDSKGYDAEASYSPDGKKIVFSSMRSAYDRPLSPEDQKRVEIDPAYFGEIYIMDADGSNQKRLTNTPGYDGGPFFSPDGQHIIWRRFDENGMVADVYTMKTDGSDVQKITDFGSMSWAPYYHPSGEYVIFTSNKYGFGNFELFIVDAAGKKQPVRVTYTDGFDGLPVFTSDGNKLAWTSGRTANGSSQIFIADWNHAAALYALASAPERIATQKFREVKKIDFNRVKRLDDTGRAVDGPADFTISPTSFSPEISEADLKTMTGYLAADQLEGRLTGTTGSKTTASFTAKYFEGIGLVPAGDSGRYFQRFPFTSGIQADTAQNKLIVTTPEKTASYEFDQHFRPLGFTANDSVTAEVVFAGYGLRLLGEPGKGYDSYAGLDVKDKIVLVLRYVPENVSTERRQELNRYAGLRYKALLAREQGAKGMLVVAGPNSPNTGELIRLSFDQSLGNSGLPVASISMAVAETMFKAAGKDLKATQTELDRENFHYEGEFPLRGVTVTLKTHVERKISYDNNVLALLPPNGDLKSAEYVLVGAHYDHLGHGDHNSLAREDERGQIHNGADDNASGTALVLELAGKLARLRKEKPEQFQRGVIFALWSGEELGIIGSSYFADHPTIPLESIIAYLNYDMVGRLRDNTLYVQGVGSSKMWKKLLERRNVLAGFNLSLSDDPYQPTDITALYPKGIPVLGFFTGSHVDYHRPTDDADKLNYEGLRRIADFSERIVMDLVKSETRPDYAIVERSAEQQGNRASLRAYLGTIPDYVSDVKGVKLSDVKAGGPADKAGLQAGDVIVGLAGQTVTNIYEYTYALDALKIGEPVEIVVMRNGEKKTLTIVPEAR
jgi:Tol biopolymer transport system component